MSMYLFDVIAINRVQQGRTNDHAYEQTAISLKTAPRSISIARG